MSETREYLQTPKTKTCNMKSFFYKDERQPQNFVPIKIQLWA